MGAFEHTGGDHLMGEEHIVNWSETTPIKVENLRRMDEDAWFAIIEAISEHAQKDTGVHGVGEGDQVASLQDLYNARRDEEKPLKIEKRESDPEEEDGRIWIRTDL